LLATDVADYLVTRGVAFRDAHHIVGKAVAESEKRACTLDALPLDVWKKIHPACDQGIQKLFDAPKALARRKMTGAPGKAQIKRELAKWKKALNA
jgi:argininosuccinate lyase